MTEGVRVELREGVLDALDELFDGAEIVITIKSISNLRAAISVDVKQRERVLMRLGQVNAGVGETINVTGLHVRPHKADLTFE